MRKRAIIALGLAAALILAGCGKDAGQEENVTLGEYRGLQVDRAITQISDDAVEEEIASQLEANAAEKEVKGRGIQEGDMVNVDYTSVVDGEEFESEEDFALEVGSGDLGTEVEEALLGLKVGAKREVEAVLPEDLYGEPYGGKTAKYSLKVKRIYQSILPELNKKYVKKYTDYDTVEEYRESVKDELYQMQESANEESARYQALDQIVQDSQIGEVPQELHDSIYTSVESSYAQFAEMFGIERSEFVSDEDLEKEVVQMANMSLVVDAIAQKESISVSDEELQSYIDQICEENSYDSEEELLEEVSREDLSKELLQEKVTDFVMENAEIHEISQQEYDDKYNSMEDEEEETDSVG